MHFAVDAKDGNQYGIALKAFQYVMNKGKENAVYEEAG